MSYGAALIWQHLPYQARPSRVGHRCEPRLAICIIAYPSVVDNPALVIKNYLALKVTAVLHFLTADARRTGGARNRIPQIVNRAQARSIHRRLASAIACTPIIPMAVAPSLEHCNPTGSPSASASRTTGGSDPTPSRREAPRARRPATRASAFQVHILQCSPVSGPGSPTSPTARQNDGDTERNQQIPTLGPSRNDPPATGSIHLSSPHPVSLSQPLLTHAASLVRCSTVTCREPTSRVIGAPGGSKPAARQAADKDTTSPGTGGKLRMP
jgi:hypothetical protein